MNLFDDPYLSNVMIDRSKIQTSLGITLREESISYPDFNVVGIEELLDMLSKSMGYMEYVSEYMARTKKRLLDGETYINQLLGSGIQVLSAQLNKSTGLKDLVKSDGNYVKHEEVYNSLKSYYEYLERLYEVINKYHYAVKLRIGMLEIEQRKPKNAA